MKIARIETFILGTGSAKDLLFCRVETESGLFGWGEAYVTQGKEKVVAECIRAMAPHLIGRSAFNIRHTGQIMYEDFAIKRGSPELLAAWSAVEIASWDILGKHAGLPVYNLIGGASRERVRVYANGWSRGTTIEEGVERGLKVKAMGFTAAKFDPFPGPWRSFVDRRDEDFAIACVRAMREALGPEFELLIEAHRRFAPAHAIRIGHRLAEFGIDWYEEPCLSENIELVAEVRRAVPIPIVTGEAMADADRMGRRKPPVGFDQQLEIGPQCLAHRPDIVDREILVAPIDKAAPRARERIELGGRETHFLDLQPAFDPLLDRRPARPAIGIDAHALTRRAADQIVDRQSGALADDVPGRDFDRAPRRHQLQ